MFPQESFHCEEDKEPPNRCIPPELNRIHTRHNGSRNIIADRPIAHESRSLSGKVTTKSVRGRRSLGKFEKQGGRVAEKTACDCYCGSKLVWNPVRGTFPSIIRASRLLFSLFDFTETIYALARFKRTTGKIRLFAHLSRKKLVWLRHRKHEQGHIILNFTSSKGGNRLEYLVVESCGTKPFVFHDQSKKSCLAEFF